MKLAQIRFLKKTRIALLFLLSSLVSFDAYSDGLSCALIWGKIKQEAKAVITITEPLKLSDMQNQSLFDEANWAAVLNDQSYFGQLVKKTNIKVSTAVRGVVTGNKNPVQMNLSKVGMVRDRLNVAMTTSALRPVRKVFGLPDTPTRFAPHWLLALPAGWVGSQYLPKEIAIVSDPVGATVSEGLGHLANELNNQADILETEKALRLAEHLNTQESIAGLMLIKSDYRYQGLAYEYDSPTLSNEEKNQLQKAALADYQVIKRNILNYYQSENFKKDLKDGSLIAYLKGEKEKPQSVTDENVLLGIAEHLTPLMMFVEESTSKSLPEYIRLKSQTGKSETQMRIGSEQIEGLIKNQVSVLFAQEKIWSDFSSLMLAEAGLLENSRDVLNHIQNQFDSNSVYNNKFSQQVIGELRKGTLTPSSASLLVGEYFHHAGSLRADNILGWERIDPKTQIVVGQGQLEEYMDEKLAEHKTLKLRKPSSIEDKKKKEKK